MTNDIAAPNTEIFDGMVGKINAVCGLANDISSNLKFPDKEVYLKADRLLTDISAAFNEVESKRKELTRPLDDLKSKIMEAAKSKTGPLSAAKETLRRAMSAYTAAEEAWAAKERKRIEAENKKKEEDRKLEIAAQAEKAGDHKAADVIINEPIKERPAFVPTANDVASSTRRKVWNIEVTDPKAFVAAWIRGEANVPVQAVTIDEGMLKRMTQAAKGEVSWPGVRTFEEFLIGTGR